MEDIVNHLLHIYHVLEGSGPEIMYYVERFINRWLISMTENDQITAACEFIDQLGMKTTYIEFMNLHYKTIDEVSWLTNVAYKVRLWRY